LTVIDTIESPADLKSLSRTDMRKLAGELRSRIVEVVSKNGGHLAPSLGVVELTIALHHVFDSPRDKILWDVGHQSYAHKLLTGRRDRFDSLRQYGGISGFTKISESPHDAFTTGHSSTSISAGIGITTALHLKNDPAKVIAVIGDGSMTAGLAYEALNQVGDIHKDRNFLVVLNDNEMSISPNVGALSSLLSRTFSAGKLQEWRKDLGDFLKSLPRIGGDMYQLAKRAEESFKAFTTPGMLFEAFNFDYFGPIDGHNLDHLIDILNNIKKINEPVLLHVTTRKGKGYEPAEKNPVYFHGCGCFDVATGNCVIHSAKAPSYTKVFGDTMVSLGQQNKRIVAVTAAMPEGTGLAEFSKRFPERFFDVGIAEQHGVTFAAGMATQGLRPVVAIYSTFLQRAYDQILHDVCIEKLPVIFALDRGGIVGEDGVTHHGLFDFSYLGSMPNMTIMAPKDENELRRMLLTALEHDGPTAIRYPRGASIGVALEEPIRPLPIGEAEVLRKGDSLLILAVGRMVCEAIKAAELLSEKGIEATVVNCRFVKPLDRELICRLTKQIPFVVTAEEHVLHGGFGSMVLECLMDAGVSEARVSRIGIKDRFVEHGDADLLREKWGLNYQGIIAAALQLMGPTNDKKDIKTYNYAFISNG
jgi:1-deoxy-D-xylulose-5-phosphate synthase